jgi:uncharacterized protein YjbI with pentapeptide repeats
MADQEAVERLRAGAAAWNRWRVEARVRVPDLAGARLAHADLAGADLSRANLVEADLSLAQLAGADLRGADLSRAFVRRADFSDATLRGARLAACDGAGAYLNGADLSFAECAGAQLNDADLSGARLATTVLRDANLRHALLAHATCQRTLLAGADLTGALLAATVLADLDLRAVQGLDAVRHDGPSSLSFDTVYRSAGRIPASFLQGCGLPDEVIAYLPSLVGAEQALRFYSVFISYSTRDEEFARRLHARLRAEHVRVWFAPEDLRGGRKLHEQIAEGIELHDRLLLVLSEHSMASEWVTTEIRRARRQERREHRRKLFPIALCPFETLRAWECFDADSGKDLGVEVREYFVPDFSGWKDHDAFEAAFAKLLNALRSEERGEPAPV